MDDIPGWKDALVKVYDRSLIDPAFRLLLQTAPLQAVAEETGIVLPAGTKIQFVADRQNFTYCYLLPPVIGQGQTQQDQDQALISWAVKCTEGPTTN